ncbi:MAG: F0F1 ATP synthase subunit A [Candidatus Methylacidiphilales bacterium]|nr:F0F1 ATP synthase subunit A [Candidatus Methylacidiphilales bacterium]
MIVALVVAASLIAFAQVSLRQPALVPGPLQNFWEALIEGLASLLESILGWKLLQSTFWFFATIFIFILASNLQALMPGVGTIGSGYGEHWWALDHITMPFMRGANADVTLTFAMAVSFFFLWWYWAFKFNGPLGVLKHLFGSQAKLGGVLGLFVSVIFLFVGLIEVVSIMVRPISLTFRLYGNIYGGEAMIDQIKHMTGYWAGLALIPVYTFELLVALVQALVFCLLTAVFTALMCKHDDSHSEEGGHGHH